MLFGRKNKIGEDATYLLPGHFPNFEKFYVNHSLYGAPEESRTPNLQIRSLMLYPIELRARNDHKTNGSGAYMQVIFEEKAKGIGNYLFPLLFVLI